MGKLVLHLPSGTLHEVGLDKERITIGRRHDNDVCLPYPAVSGEHAAIVTVLNDSFLEDLGSTNGTLVNGQRVLKHLLRDNDLIDIGRQRLVYLADSNAQATPLPPDVLLRDLEGLRDQVERVRNRRSDARGGAAPPLVEDDELLADLEEDAVPPGAEAAAAHAPASRSRGAPARAAAKPSSANAAPPQLAPSVERRRASVPKVPVLDTSAEREMLEALDLHVAPDMGARATGATIETDATAVRRIHAQAAQQSPVDGEATCDAAAGEPDAMLRTQPALWVRVLDGPNAGRELAITRDEFWMGSVGTQVARLVREQGAWRIVPIEGSEAPTLNGKPVAAGGAFVAPGDRFHVAGAEIELTRR